MVLPSGLAGLVTLLLLAVAAADQFNQLAPRGRRLLAQRRRSASADDLTTQRWVGAQTQDDVMVSDMTCTFDVPLDADIGTFPTKGTSEAHYIYCDLHHGWAGGVFGQFVPQLQRGMATSAANATTYVLQDEWLDSWHIQAQYIFSIPPPHLPEPVLGAVGELIKVSPGDKLSTRIHYDGVEGAWVLEIGVVKDPLNHPLEFTAGKTSTLKVTAPFMGVNPLYPSPYKGNTSCPDYHQVRIHTKMVDFVLP